MRSFEEKDFLRSKRRRLCIETIEVAERIDI